MEGYDAEDPNAFAIFFSRIIGSIVGRIVFKNERGYGTGFWMTTIVAKIFLAILASIIVFWFSRKREYRAHSGSAAMAGKRQMIGALKSLKTSVNQPHLLNEMAAFRDLG